MHNDQHIYEDSKLLSLLAEDSEYAFQLIYDRYRNRIYQTSIRYLKSPVIAQEVVQDVFLKLWFERKNLKKDQPVEAWLYTVAKNNLINRLKKIANEWKALNGFKKIIPKTDESTADKVVESQYNKLLQEALQSLPEQQQKVFRLARFEQLTYAEIAEKLSISPLTVKTHMARALDNMRNYFSEHGELFLPVSLILFSNFF